MKSFNKYPMFFKISFPWSNTNHKFQITILNGLFFLVAHVLNVSQLEGLRNMCICALGCGPKVVGDFGLGWGVCVVGLICC